jgi:hypothetical protein
VDQGRSERGKALAADAEGVAIGIGEDVTLGVSKRTDTSGHDASRLDSGANRLA